MDQKVERPVNVVICIPSGDEWKALTAQSLANLVGVTTVQGNGKISVGLLNNKASMITGSRNDIVKGALNVGADFLLWIDSDMVFPPSALIKLLSHKQPIVGATYNKRQPPFETLGRFAPPKEGQPLPSTGLVEALYMPSGFILVAAEIYKKLPYPWYYETYHPEGSAFESFTRTLEDISYLAPPAEVLAELNKSETFRTWCDANFAERKRICGDNITMSEDYNFSRKVLARGFRMWCDLDLSYQMGHVSGEHVITTLQAQSTWKDSEHFYQSIEGWFAAESIYQKAVNAAADGAKFVEVGTWKGKSAAFMAVEIAKSKKKIDFFTIDTFLGSDELAQRGDPDVKNGTLQEKARKNLAPVAKYVTVVEGDAVETAAKFEDASLDFIFLDGRHTYEGLSADITAWMPKLKPSGTIAGDDYNWPGVQRAVIDAFGAATTDGRVWEVAHGG